MKPRLVIWFPAAFVAALVFTIPSFAQTNSSGSTTTATSPADSNTTAPAQPATTTTRTTTTTENSSGSWQESATNAAHNAEVATEKAYNHVARDVRDISLEARIKAVLHENKSTRDSDVHVTADNGIVTLTGQVPSKRNAQTVQEVVASVYGVKAVNNDINYPRNRGTPPDADSTGVARPAYSDTAPAENVPGR
jgi:BON domain-containing protein